MKDVIEVLDGLAEQSLNEDQSKQEWIDYLNDLIEEAKTRIRLTQREIDND